MVSRGLVAVCAIAGAVSVIMVYGPHSSDVWGWFLFLAFLVML